eukprot:Rmarinus@m.3911
MGKYERFLKLKDPNARACPHCDMVQIGDPSQPNMTCLSCDYQYCFFHSNMHPGRRCKAKNGEAVSTRLRNGVWKSFNTRKCPHCAQRIQKNGGCPCMTCRCGGIFCWKCGRKYHPEHGHSRTFLVTPRQLPYACHSKKLWALRAGAIVGTVGLAPVAACAAVAAAPFAGTYYGGRSVAKKWKSAMRDRECKRLRKFDAQMTRNFELGRKAAEQAYKAEVAKLTEKMEGEVEALRSLVKELQGTMNANIPTGAGVVPPSPPSGLCLQLTPGVVPPPPKSVPPMRLTPGTVPPPPIMGPPPLK